MADGNVNEFVQGDVILHRGETYQVHENRGENGLVSAFPSDQPELFSMRWDDECRKIGNQPLPAPAPCSVGDCCPTQHGKSAI